MFRHPRGEGDPDAVPGDHDAVIGCGALSVPETDPEQIAFKLWNEGRVDEAVRFLEREVAAERSRHTASPDNHEELSVHLTDTGKIEPVSDWRDRHRAALKPAKFNAFGATVHTIDLVAEPGDAILPHPPEGRRAGWIVGIGVAALAVSTAGAFWGGVPAPLKEIALPFIKPAAQNSPVPTVPPADSEGSALEVATAPENVIMPADAEEATEPSGSATVEDDVPPPDDAAPPEDSAADAGDNPAGAGDTPADTAALASNSDPEELAEAPGSTDAVSSAAPADAGATPVAVARLPRQRPEPPARVASLPPRIGAPPATLDDQRLRFAGAPAPALRYFRRNSPYYDPRTPPPNLTPAEYQILLTRRAWAENYAARQRALAEWRARQRRDLWDEEVTDSAD